VAGSRASASGSSSVLAPQPGIWPPPSQRHPLPQQPQLPPARPPACLFAQTSTSSSSTLLPLTLPPVLTCFFAQARASSPSAPPPPSLPPASHAPCPHKPHLLVCVDQDQRVLELLLIKDGRELLAAGGQPVHVAAVNHVDDRLRVAARAGRAREGPGGRCRPAAKGGQPRAPGGGAALPASSSGAGYGNSRVVAAPVWPDAGLPA
jgi:hypothetical protein